MAIKVSVSTAAPLKIQVQNETAKMVPADLRIGSVIKGLDGKSAYQIAVENGFEGTESEWLQSLEGGPGFSPSVHLERKENGVLITAENQDGQESQMVYDGGGVGGSGGSSNVYVGTEEPPEEAEVWIDPEAALMPDEIPSIRVQQTQDGAIITATSLDGVTTATIKNGKDGEPGKPGKTPVKGTDYYTEADKAEMVAAVIAVLPVYGGETA